MTGPDRRWAKLTKAERREIIASYGKDSPIVREMRGLPPLPDPVTVRKPKGKQP